MSQDGPLAVESGGSLQYSGVPDPSTSNGSLKGSELNELLRELVLQDPLGDASTSDAERDRHGQTQGAECDCECRQDHRSRDRDLLERHCARQNQNQPTNGPAQQPR